MVKESTFEVFLVLSISGDSIDIDDITRHLEIIPSRIERKGKRKRPQIETFFTKNKWSFIFAEKSNREVVELIDEFVNNFEGKKRVLRKISKKMDVNMFIAVYKHQYWPSLKLEKRHISFLSDIGADIDIDLYG